jgi:hypothetical protein
MEKTCTRCLITKPLDEFYKQKAGKFGHYSYCKRCNTVIQRETRLKYLDKRRAAEAAYYLRTREEHRARHRLWAYKVVPTRPEPAVCEICGAAPTAKRSLHLDHCHEKKIFRGWLCHHCNTTLGHVKDNPETLRKLARYLEQFDQPQYAAPVAPLVLSDCPAVPNPPPL